MLKKWLFIIIAHSFRTCYLCKGKNIKLKIQQSGENKNEHEKMDAGM